MKKILSLVLTLALVLGSFSVAFAEETSKPESTDTPKAEEPKDTAKAGGMLSDIAKSPNKEAINVVNNLGIVTGFPDGSFKPEENVNRAQFAAMITRALGTPESALAGLSSTSFKDVAGYQWAVKYLAFCEGKKIMNGYGDGTVRPGNTITPAEAVAMTLRAVGYTPNSAALVGTWPSNYITLGQDLGLYKEVTAGAQINRESAAQVIYNALGVQKVQVDKDGATTGLNSLDHSTTPATQVPISMLTSGLGCKPLPEQIIDGTEDALINLNPFIGALASGYTKDDKIISLKTKSQFISGEVTEVAGGKVTEIKVDDVAYAVKDYAAPAEFVNADKVAAGTIVPAKKDTLTLAAEVSGKTLTKVHSLIKWNVTKHKKVGSNVPNELKKFKLLGTEFLKDDNREIDTKSFTLEGVSTLDKIAENNVVYVYANSKNKIKRVVVGTEVVKDAKITGKKKDDYKVGDKKYAEANPKDAGSAVLKVGETYDFYLDGFGDIYYAKSVSKGANKFGVALGVQNSDGTFTGLVRYVNAEGKKVDSKFVQKAPDVMYNGIAQGTLFAYSVDKAGEFNSRDKDVTAETFAPDAGPPVKPITKGSNSLTDSTKSYKTSSDVVVFVKKAADKYEIGKFADIKNEINNDVDVLRNNDNVILALVVDKADYGKLDSDVFAVFNAKGETVKGDDTVTQYEGFNSKGEEITVTMTDNSGDALANNAKASLVWYFQYDSDKNISKPAVVADGTPADAKVVKDVKVVAASKVDGNSYFDGTKWYDLSSKGVVFKLADGEFEKSDLGSIDLSDLAIKLYMYDVDKDAGGYEIIIWTKDALV